MLGSGPPPGRPAVDVVVVCLGSEFATPLTLVGVLTLVDSRVVQPQRALVG